MIQVAVAELLVVGECVVEGGQVIAADHNQQQEYAIPDKGEIQGEPKPQELQFFRILRQGDFFLIYMMEAAVTEIHRGVGLWDTDSRGAAVNLGCSPIWVEVFVD